GRQNFDAWGRRLASGAPSATTRGFTGHEELDSYGLVNMNARLYDPVIGRFLSADTQIDSPYAMQLLNGYSYVGNNPLSYTDPTGHSIATILEQIAIEIVLNAILPGGSTPIGMAIDHAIAAYVATLVTTENQEGALINAAAAVAFTSVNGGQTG